MIRIRKSGNRILVYWKDTLEACLHATNIPFTYRIWSVLHGFNPEVAWFKGINNNNRANYLKEYTY